MEKRIDLYENREGKKKEPPHVSWRKLAGGSCPQRKGGDYDSTGVAATEVAFFPPAPNRFGSG
jgi:hypothetical protein